MLKLTNKYKHYNMCIWLSLCFGLYVDCTVFMKPAAYEMF